jgi:5-methylthioadenosine/S-adenosylhomocysteine deaminase
MRRIWISLLLIAAARTDSVDAIWTARWVVTENAHRDLIENGALAVANGRIVAVGPRADVTRRYQARQTFSRPNAILMPGLINAHTHAAMSLFRGIADDLKLEDWLQRYIFPAEAKNVSPDFVYWGTRLACLEMMRAGVTTLVDMYYFEDRAAEAVKQAGLRGVMGETIIASKSPDSPTPADALRFTERFIRRFRNDPLITPAVAPHALYTNTPESLRGARSLANRYRVPLLIHLAETRTEDQTSRAKYGLSPARYLDSLGLWNGWSLAAHGVWLDPADRRLLQARGVGIAHCPSSNMKLASGIAPVTAMLAEGIPVGLGTDGPAGSNNDFDLMEEMNLAADLQKVATGDPRSLPAPQAVGMATILGAQAIGLGRQIGSLDPGKRADFITLRLDVPNAIPLYHVYSQIVYALKASDVEDTVVEGHLLVEYGRPLHEDTSAIYAKAFQYQNQVRSTLKQ